MEEAAIHSVDMIEIWCYLAMEDPDSEMSHFSSVVGMWMRNAELPAA